MSWNIGLFDGGFYLIGNFYVPSERHQIKSNKKKRFLVQHKLNSFRIIYEENGQLLRTNCRCQQKLKKWYNTERWFIHFRTLTIHKTWIWCVIIDYYWQHKLRPLVAAWNKLWLSEGIEERGNITTRSCNKHKVAFSTEFKLHLLPTDKQMSKLSSWNWG